jgi:glucose-1-phosphate thymidylyltransferase
VLPKLGVSWRDVILASASSVSLIIVRALVLSGGAGTRLRPFSHTTPKQLVPIANEPVLFHALRAIRALGIKKTGIIVSSPGTAIREALGDGSLFDMDITYLPQDEPLGLAHCVLLAREFLADDDFLMYLGDNVFFGGIADPFAEFQRDRPTAQLVLTKVSNPSVFGVAEIDYNGRVLGLEEKPEHPRSDLIVTGAYFFTPAIHEAVRNVQPSWRGELEITHALQWLLTQGHDVRAYTFCGHWRDTGTTADLLDCNKLLLAEMTTRIAGTIDSATEITGPVIIEEGASVCRSVLRGPLMVAAGTSIEDSQVGPFTAIGKDCTLRDAIVENSILLERACVHGVRSINGSIIGRGGQVRMSQERPSAHRLLVGDNSVVEITV